MPRANIPSAANHLPTRGRKEAPPPPPPVASGMYPKIRCQHGIRRNTHALHPPWNSFASSTSCRPSPPAHTHCYERHFHHAALRGHQPVQPPSTQIYSEQCRSCDLQRRGMLSGGDIIATTWMRVILAASSCIYLSLTQLQARGNLNIVEGYTPTGTQSYATIVVGCPHRG